MVGIQQPKIPVQLQEKNGPGPRRPCHLVLNVSAEAATLSWSFIHSYWVLPTCSVSPYLDMCFHCYFRFFKHTGFFFFFLISIQKLFFVFFFRRNPRTAARDRPRCVSESEAAAGPSPGGTVSPSVYTFLRAIAPRKLSESGTRPGAVLVTLKFLLQFCQI